jgi:hypothetical protein
VLARLGTTPIPAGITVYVLDSLGLTSFVPHVVGETDGDHWLYFQGVPTVDATGTIASVTPRDATNNTDGVITGSASLVSHVGKLLRITSGARAGAQFLLTANPSGATVRISQPLAAAWNNDRASSLQVGDPYEVLSFPSFADAVTIEGAQDVEFGYLVIGTGGQAHTVYATSGAVVKFDGCVIDGFDADRGADVTAYCSRFSSGMRTQGDATILTWGCVSDGGSVRSGGRASLNDHISQGDHIIVEPGGFLRCEEASRFLAGYDYSGAVFVFQRESEVVFDGYLTGSGITGVYARLQVLDGARVALGHAPQIAGTGTELQIGGTAVGVGGRKRTFAQLPWTHAGSGTRVYLLGAAAHPSPRPSGEFASYLAVGSSLLGSTATTTSTASHSLTLTGSDPRTIQVNLTLSAGSYTGTWTVSGHDSLGAVQTEVLTPTTADGDETLETKKTFAPGAITLSRTAMGNTSGHYTATVGNGFGLPFKAYEGPTLGFGHLLSMSLEGFGSGTLGASTAFVQGPTLSPPHGALMFFPGFLDGVAGGTFEVCYLATE